MRVPVPVAALLALAAVACGWWLGTRGSSTVTRQAAAVATPPPNPAPAPTPQPEPAANPAPAADTPPAEPEPLPDFGDLEASPALDTYADVAKSTDAATLVRLATALEQKGAVQHALLAWERVIDHTQASADTRAAALQAVSRLRPQLPPWNVDPAGRTKVVLRVAGHPALRDTLAPLVTEAAQALASASSGLLEVTPDFAAGPPSPALVPAPPAAVSLLGARQAKGDDTEVVTLTAPAATTEALRPALWRTLCLVVHHHLAKIPDLAPLPEPDPAADSAQWLQSAPTRLAWDLLARSLASP